jgi:hypothetical protein
VERDGPLIGTQHHLEQPFFSMSAEKTRPCSLAALQNGSLMLFSNGLGDARFVARFSAVLPKFRYAIGGKAGDTRRATRQQPRWMRWQRFDSGRLSPHLTEGPVGVL